MACIVMIILPEYWRTMPGSYYYLNSCWIFWINIDHYGIIRGKKHTHNADGRKGRGEQQILSVSSADKENNAGARGNLPQTSGTPDQNLTQKETPNRKPVTFNDQVNSSNPLAWVFLKSNYLARTWLEQRRVFLDN